MASFDEIRSGLIAALRAKGWPEPQSDNNDVAVTLKWGEWKTPPWLCALVGEPAEIDRPLGDLHVGLQFSSMTCGGAASRYGSLDDMIAAIDSFRWVIVPPETDDIQSVTREIARGG